jgi:Transcription elongation factor, GreA/GreB, C-term
LDNNQIAYELLYDEYIDKLKRINELKRKEADFTGRMLANPGIEIFEYTKLVISKLSEEREVVEKRMYELKGLLASSSYIVVANSRVKIHYIEEDEYDDLIVKRSHESSSQNGEVDEASPIGKALIDGRKGDIVLVNAPKGKYKVRIIEICNEINY